MRALLSVHDKAGLTDLARGLVGEPRVIQDVEQLPALAGGQRVRRRRPLLPAPGPDAMAPAVNGGA